MRRAFYLILASLILVSGSPVHAQEKPPLRVGSKRFTESFILGEIAVALARATGEAPVTHEQGLGATAIVFRALEQGSIDLYPEYTGTIAEAILKSSGRPDLETLRRALAPRGIGISDPLGFENKYALAVPAALAERLNLRTVSDLARHPELRVGLSHEFLGRQDGWPGLVAHYRLQMPHVQGLDHGLAYEAIQRGAIDVMDVYTTDAKLKKYHLRVLEDDRRFFPPYQAVFLYRDSLPQRYPRTWQKLQSLAGRLNEATMIELNGRAELDGLPFAQVAQEFVTNGLALTAAPSPEAARQSLRHELAQLARGTWQAIRVQGPQHLYLVLVSLALAILVGIPMGILATHSRMLAQTVLSLTGLIQTIPSLALLCFFIPVMGTGPVPALAALFLYSLLPIVRNTYTGLEEMPPPLRESAAALGLSSLAQLFLIRLPMASRTILAGIKTSAVINVGTATLAAFIGAGGFGERISTGLTLNDPNIILHGAIPAALLALLVQWVFDLMDRVAIPRGLRLL
ncbi:MAG: ABC transporter permease subunit [Armatimonadetes bacterium]|nr:ABC transporter permease subunit [Armatimonadota bacterium]